MDYPNNAQRRQHEILVSLFKSPLIFQSLKKQDNLIREITEKKESVLQQEA